MIASSLIGLWATGVAQAQGLLASVLPSSRSVQVGNPASAFATIINTGASTATACGLAPATPVPATFLYQTTASATNLPIGSPNTPVDILPGGMQSYVFAFTPTAPFPPTDVAITFSCENAAPAQVVVGLNTLLLSASAAPVPDIVALAATIDGDGVVRAASLALGGNVGAFAVATVNVGAAGLMTVSGDFGAASPAAAVTVCESDPTTSVCLVPPAPAVTRHFVPMETPTFAVFVRFDGPVALDPAVNRAFLRFVEASPGGATRGATSVALHAPAVAPPRVTITASAPTAAETGPTFGVFTFTRTGDTSAPLLVLYTVAGTATPGTDYLPLAGSVLLPAGAASAPVVVTPLADSEDGEENETVVVTLRADSTYSIGPPGTATVTIAGESLHETRINSGGPAYTDHQARLWKADTDFVGGAQFVTPAAIAGTLDGPLYQSERFGTAFSYRVPVPNGRYAVTLHFAENFLNGPGQRLFDVTLEGVKVLEHFDIFAAAGAKHTAVTQTFTPEVVDGFVDIAFAGVLDNAAVDAIEIVAQPPGHAVLHVVIQAPKYAVDYDGDGSEPVALDGSASHTHEPGHTLISYVWADGGTPLGVGPVQTPVLALGRHELTLTIGDDATPQKTLSGAAVVHVYPITAVGGVLATYHPGGSIDAPGPVGFTEVRPSMRVDAIIDRIGGSPFFGDVAIVLSGHLSVPAPATYAFQLVGGAASRLTIDGAPVAGPVDLPAGRHAIEARFAVGTAADLPVEVVAAIGGGPTNPLAPPTLTHDETALAPFINALTLASGSEQGGETVTIQGLGFFATGSGTVAVNWGGQVLTVPVITVTPSAITLVTPPGAGTIPVTVQTPNGVSNTVAFSYRAGAPVSFTTSAIAGTTLQWPTQAAWGPDGRLYVGSTVGVITIYTFGDDYEVLETQTVGTLASVHNPAILGLTFNPFDAPSPVKVYVAHAALFASNNGMCPTGPDPYSGQVTVLTGPNFNEIAPLITGLPVSNHDHAINGMEFDHNGDLLITVGGMTNGGIPHCNMGGLPESPLSAAILKARLSKGAEFVGAITYTGAQPPFENTDQRAGDHVSVEPGSDVEVFASGFRNPFDLVLTTWGRIYATDNGPDLGFGPESIGPAAEGPEAEDEDELDLIEMDDYYGHPNRNRGRTDSRQNVYGANSQPADPASFISALALLASSSNGIAEYRAQTFSGAMRGELLTQVFDGATYRIRLSADGRRVVGSQPLDVDLAALDIVTGPGGVLLATVFDPGTVLIARPNDPGPDVRVFDIHPWRAPAVGGTPFVIGGRGFVPGQTAVAIGGTPAALTSVSATRIRGIIPPRANPTADLLTVVVTVSGQPAELPAAFRYLFAAGLENTGAQATAVIDPGGGLADSSTFNGRSFRILNQSSRGQLIDRVRIDLRTAIFRDLVFDPDGLAGDLASKPFSADSPPGDVGFLGAVMHAPHDGGFDAIDIRFGAFAPGSTFEFSIDADPTSIRGVSPPGPGESGSVSGLELTGARVTVYFSDGTMLSGRTFQVPGSVTGSRVTLKAGLPEAPHLQVVGLSSPPPTTVTTAEQTVVITGPPGARGSLLVVEGGLFTAGVPGGGADLDPFEANTAVSVTEIPFDITLFGFVRFPVTLTRSGGPETGINHLVAVLRDGAGLTGPLSAVVILKRQ